MKFEHTFRNDEVLGQGEKCNLGQSCSNAQKGLCNILKCDDGPKQNFEFSEKGDLILREGEAGKTTIAGKINDIVKLVMDLFTKEEAKTLKDRLLE